MAALQQKDANGDVKPSFKRQSYSVSKVESTGNYDGSAAMAESTPNVDEDGQVIEFTRMSKGKAREGSDPFRDPSASVDNTSIKRSSTIKPTSRSPIVTPGSAPTIRHRANERLLKEGGNIQMPSIVATDDDEEKEAVRHLQEMAIDPFQSAAEVDQQHKYLLARDAAKKTILTGGDERTPIVTAAPPPIMAPIRKSMSSSKFNEIGLDDEETLAPNWLGSVDETQQSESSEGRKSWWTEWLCGCENIEEEEDQQTGRTMPG